MNIITTRLKEKIKKKKRERERRENEKKRGSKIDICLNLYYNWAEKLKLVFIKKKYFY